MFGGRCMMGNGRWKMDDVKRETANRELRMFDGRWEMDNGSGRKILS